MDDKLKRRLAGAAVLLAATFVAVSLLPTPEQAAQQPDVDVVTIPLHEVASTTPPPPSADNTPPTLAAPQPPATETPASHDGDGTDAQEVDIAGDDDGPADAAADARKPVQLALDSTMQNGAQTKPAEKPAVASPKPVDKPAPQPPKPADKPAATKPADKPAATKPAEKLAEKATEKPAAKPAEKAAEKSADKPVVAQKPVEKPADKPADKPVVATKPAEKPAEKPAAPAASSWAVQVGGFADIGRARSVQDKLKTLGQASFISPMDTPKGTLYRVRSGPYASHDAAQAALGKLNSNGFPEARIVAP